MQVVDLVHVFPSLNPMEDEGRGSRFAHLFNPPRAGTDLCWGYRPSYGVRPGCRSGNCICYWGYISCPAFSHLAVLVSTRCLAIAHKRDLADGSFLHSRSVMSFPVIMKKTRLPCSSSYPMLSSFDTFCESSEVLRKTICYLFVFAYVYYNS
jgi:hypothetical protein